MRRAIAYAVDKQALVDRNTGGLAQVAWADQPPFMWAYEPNVDKYPHDVAKARALLQEAGWTPGTRRHLPQGRPAALAAGRVQYVENATRRLVAVQVQAMLRQAGIDASIKAYPANLFFATYGQGGILSNGKYDLSVSGWIAGIDPDDHSLYTCDQIPRQSHPDGANYARYCSPAMDALQKSALETYDDRRPETGLLGDPETDRAGLPTNYIWFPRQIQPINPDFKGFAPNPVNEAWNAYEWEI